MKKIPVLFLLALAFSSSAHADDQLREVQQALKDQGFYYGVVDGEEGTETNAAVRRYQIRNGLEITGKLNAETAAALQGKAAAPVPPVARDQGRPPVPVKPSIAEADKNFLRRQDRKAAQSEAEDIAPAPQTPPPAERAPSSTGPLFRQTPYESAPQAVQRDTLRRAQARLAREGFYRGEIDGASSAETQRAIAEFQRDADLRPTGRLDIPTLSELNLLPSRRTFVPDRRGDDYAPPPPPSRRVYRGIWIR